MVVVWLLCLWFAVSFVCVLLCFVALAFDLGMLIVLCLWLELFLCYITGLVWAGFRLLDWVFALCFVAVYLFMILLVGLLLWCWVYWG